MLRRLLVCVFLLITTGTAHATHHHTRSHIQHSSQHFSDGRPSAWCGWFMRHHVPTDPGPSFNLAANWAHYGTSVSGPNTGVIVVWPHHVGQITGYDTQQHEWIVLSGNDGHAIRNRPRPLGRVIAYRRI